MMNRINILFAIFITGISMKVNTQNFESLTSQIFFNVDIKRHDTSLLTDFKSIPALAYQERTGWTSYPPNVNLDSILPFHTFLFSTHPYFKSGAEDGSLFVFTNKQETTIKGMALTISFNSQSKFDSVYKCIRKLYRQYSSKEVKRPGLVKSIEEIKYFSKDETDFVIITKGANSSNPYINFAFNCWDYFGDSF